MIVYGLLVHNFPNFAKFMKIQTKTCETMHCMSSSPSVAAPTQRIMSIDVLRGLTIAFMILVNDPGNSKVSYWPLEHAHWNGWTPTDLVFPTFLFLIGCSIVFSLGSRLKRGTPRRTIAWQATKRTFWILVINFAIRLLPDFKDLHHVRLFGVLTRIALVYFCASIFYLLTQRVPSLVIAIVVLLIGYYIMLRFIPIPGAGMPGVNFPFMDQYNNLTAYIDRGFNAWTQSHLHTGLLYEKYRDPEGLLSTLPSIATCLLGILAGKLIRSEQPATKVCYWLFAGGAAGIALGYLWSIWFPINKNMWTSSYVLLSAGIAGILLGCCYWIYDVRQQQKTSHLVRVLSWPCLVFGSNAITAYVISSLWGKLFGFIQIHEAGHIISPLGWINKHGFEHWGASANTSLAYAICYVILCFLPVWALWRRGIFLRV